MSSLFPYHESSRDGSEAAHRAASPLTVPVATSLEIRAEVNTFLAELPLGTSRKDAAVEDAVAARLYALLNTRSDLQMKLNQWVGVAMGLQEVIERQHRALLQAQAQQPQQAKRRPALLAFVDGLPALSAKSGGAMAPGQTLGTALGAQQREMAGLRSQMAGLRAELLAADAAGALREQLAARTAEAERLRGEAGRLRAALVDAELDLQRQQQQQQQPREAHVGADARAAAEAVASRHAALTAPEGSATAEGAGGQPGCAVAQPQEQQGDAGDGIGGLTVRRQALEEEVHHLEECLAARSGAAGCSEALQLAERERGQLRSKVEAVVEHYATAARAERAAKEALQQELAAAQEASAAEQEAAAQRVTELSEELQAAGGKLQAAERKLGISEACLAEELEQRARLAVQLADRAQQLSAAQQGSEELKARLQAAEAAAAGAEQSRAAAAAAAADAQRQCQELRGACEGASAQKQEACQELQARMEAAAARTSKEHAAALEQLAAARDAVEARMGAEAGEMAGRLQGLETEAATLQAQLVRAQEYRDAELAAELARMQAEHDHELGASRERLAAAGAAAVGRGEAAQKLRARLDALGAELAAQHRREVLGLRAAHSAEMEQLQAEHEQELAGLAAEREVQREQAERLIAALQARLAAARADAESGRTAEEAELAWLEDRAQRCQGTLPAERMHGGTEAGSGQAAGASEETAKPCGSCDTEAGPSKVAGECTGVPQLPSLGEAQCGEDPQSSDAPRLADRQNPHTVMPAQVENIAQSSGHMLEAAGLEHQAASAAAHAAGQEHSAEDVQQAGSTEDCAAAAALAHSSATHEAAMEGLRRQHACDLQELAAEAEERLSAAQRSAQQHAQEMEGRLAAEHAAALDGAQAQAQAQAAALEGLVAAVEADCQARLQEAEEQLQSLRADCEEQATAARAQGRAASRDAVAAQHEERIASLGSEMMAAVSGADAKLAQLAADRVALLAQHGADVAALREQSAAWRAGIDAEVLRLAEEGATAQRECELRLLEAAAQQAAVREECETRLIRMQAEGGACKAGLQEQIIRLAEQRDALSVEHEAELRLLSEERERLAGGYETRLAEQAAALAGEREARLALASGAGRALPALREERNGDVFNEALASPPRLLRPASAPQWASTCVKLSLRQRCGQLTADNAELSQRCRTLMSDPSDARQAAQALREENLELAAELDAAGRARMAADDAEAAALQARMQADAAHAHAAAAEPPAPGDGGGGSGEQLQEYWEERALALQERCGQLEAANSHLQTQVAGALQGQLQGELQELQGACAAMRASNRDLAEKLRDATPEPVSVPEVQELQERCAALAGTNAELDAALAREVSQLAFAGAQLQQAWRTENALKSANLELAAAAEEGRERVAELEGANAELASQLDTMQQESVALGAAAAIHSCELAAAREAAAAELADALEERDEIEEELRGQIRDLTALEASRGPAAAGPGGSPLPELVAARLRAEVLETRLAAAERAACAPARSVCTACGAGLPPPGRALPAPAAGGDPGRRAEATTADIEQLRQAHAAEVASVQDAFAARAAVLREDLQRKAEELEGLRRALGGAQAEAGGAHAALADCQDMLAELQAFSEAQQAGAAAAREQTQAAGAEAQAARAAADEASNALAKVRSEAAALSRRVTEDGEALTAREQSLEAVTLERQRLRLELAEVQGRLRAEVAAGAEAALRVETLAALLAQAHDARATGMIWQTPQAHTLSAAGSAPMVRALQPGRRRLSWHAPHAEAGDPQPEAATQQTGFQPVQQGPKASGSEAGPQQQPTEDRSQDDGHAAAAAAQPLFALQADARGPQNGGPHTGPDEASPEPGCSAASPQLSSAHFDSDQENRACEMYSMPPRYGAARALEDLCELESPAALGEAASNQPLISAASLSSLHFNALYDASGSPGKALVAQGEAPASQAPGRGTPDHKRRGGTKLAATRSMFDSPPAGLQSPPTTVLRDIAGRWHSPSQ